MQENAAVNGAPPVPVAPPNGYPWAAAPTLLFTQEKLRELVLALEEPFDVAEIKWRVTNTGQVASRSGPRLRGQMVAYADPRAYMDRLNNLFTPSGWTRDYIVQLVQNFERRERGTRTERTVTAKIRRHDVQGDDLCALRCIQVLGRNGPIMTTLGLRRKRKRSSGHAHVSGLAATCTTWKDSGWILDEKKKRPLETPRLPDWARPKTQQPVGGQARCPR